MCFVKMSLKRSTLRNNSQFEISNKLPKHDNNSYFYKIFEDSGLILYRPPNKCVANVETIIIIRNIKNNLQKHSDYPCNISTFFANFEGECKDLSIFKHYLFPNIVRSTDDNISEQCLADSVIKILLSIPHLQNNLIDFIFEKAIDLATDSSCGPWIQMILKCFCSLENLVDSERISTNLINLLDIVSEKMVRLEIITAIPDIIGDQEHDNVAAEMSRIMNEDHDLIPATLDCLSYLCLSDEQYQQLQKKTLNILMCLSKCNYFPNFVKFLLMSGHANEMAYVEAVQGLRSALEWPTSIVKPQDIATSQILTVAAIRNSMVSSKFISNAWMKTVSNCKTSIDHKPIDFVLILILYSTSEEKQKLVENLFKKQIKFDILKEDLINQAFDKYPAILRDYIKHLINLTNSLLKIKGEPIVQKFASHIYMLMFSKLQECSQTIVAELLQLGLDCKTCVMNILLILNNVASNNMSLLKPQSIQMLTLLDRMDNMTLAEIRAVMNLVCGLAYSFENSVIRDDVHMIIRKELGSSNPTIKLQGIIAGIYAVKYLMVSNTNKEHPDLPDDANYSAINYLTEGDLREAAQIIELISRSSRQFPTIIAFFYDELCDIMQSTDNINPHFLTWITDAVTNDLQQNFIVDCVETETINNLKLSMHYCLNTDSEMDEVIAINLAGVLLHEKDEVNIKILAPLFRIVQILHSKQHDGNLSSIDALLGCPVIMPAIDIDVIEDLPNSTVAKILDCLVHCVNWFRELVNAFCSQSDLILKSKIFSRINNIYTLENQIKTILMRCNFTYNPPNGKTDIKCLIRDVSEKTYPVSKKQKKKSNADESIADTIRTQGSQYNVQTFKNKIDLIHSMPFRSITVKLLNLLNTELTEDKDTESKLTIDILLFIIENINGNLENLLISKIKRTTFLTKQDETEQYNHNKAEECAKFVYNILPHIVKHLQAIILYLDEHMNESEAIFPSKLFKYVLCLEYIYSFFIIYFRWIGFKNHNISLLKCSFRTISNLDNENSISLKDLVLAVAKILQQHEKYCIQLSTAVALIEFLKTLKEYSSSSTLLKIMRNISSNFLSQLWKTPDGVLEKGLLLNQSIDCFAKVYFINNEILELKNITLLLVTEIQTLKNRNSTLNTFKCINKGNFSILYRNLGTALHEVTKSQLTKGLTNSEHLELWKDVAVILKCMCEISKTLETRNNLTAFFKKCVPVIKLFNTQGIPILDLEFKNKTQETIEILKVLQQTTRFLQSLCCHSRLKSDTVLMSKVPYMRQLLETLIYKVKAMLTTNKCSEAFWMGNLKNKNIHGEIIETQQSIDNEESLEDCDEQLPEDDDSDNTDDEMINPDSKSVSDIV